MIRVLAPALLLVAAPSLSARESLGVYESWGAFRDAKPSRCYAVAKAEGDKGGYATIANWPERRLRGTVHLVLSRDLAASSAVRLVVGAKRFELVAKGRNAWAKDAQDDAAIVAALRSASRMSVSATGASGGRFTDRYSLAGAATAIDAATIGCATTR